MRNFRDAPVTCQWLTGNRGKTKSGKPCQWCEKGAPKTGLKSKYKLQRRGGQGVVSRQFVEGKEKG